MALSLAPFSERPVIAAGYQTETNTLVAAMTVAPTTARKNAIDALIVSLKSSGAWAKMDFLYVLAAHDHQAGRLNWKNPAANTLSINGTITWTVDRGSVSDGTTGFYGTGFNHNGMTNFALDNAHIGAWCQNEATTGNPFTGTPTTNRITIVPRNGTGNLITRLNSAIGTTTAIAASKGHVVSCRAASTNYDRYKNGAVFDNVVQSSATLVAEEVLLLRSLTSYNNAHILAAAHAGSSLTAGEASAAYSGLNTYMTAVGAAP
jgi:hypothetical protein